MKKILFALMSILFFATNIQAQNNKTMKSLVAYFSTTGTTETVAKDLAAVAKADLFEIEPAQKYTSADLDWNNENSRSSIEMKDKKSRPAIKNNVQNIAQYDIIYIGFPIWWYTAPTIINTFIESHDLKGKTVVFFATSGGSGIKKANTDFKVAYPEINWKEGKLLNRADKTTLEQFVENVQ